MIYICVCYSHCFQIVFDLLPKRFSSTAWAKLVPRTCSDSKIWVPEVQVLWSSSTTNALVFLQQIGEKPEQKFPLMTAYLNWMVSGWRGFHSYWSQQRKSKSSFMVGNVETAPNSCCCDEPGTSCAKFRVPHDLWGHLDFCSRFEAWYLKFGGYFDVVTSLSWNKGSDFRPNRFIGLQQKMKLATACLGFWRLI